jgi:hypothetical protein
MLVSGVLQCGCESNGNECHCLPTYSHSTTAPSPSIGLHCIGLDKLATLQCIVLYVWVQVNMDQAHLVAAAQSNNLAQVVSLLRSSVHVNACNDWTALHYACHHTNDDMVRILLDYNANVYLTTRKGETPLHIASRHNKQSVAQMLLEANANVNAITRMNLTPLHYAAYLNRDQIAMLLIARGADLSIRDVWFRASCITPLPHDTVLTTCSISQSLSLSLTHSLALVLQVVQFQNTDRGCSIE